MIGAGGGSYQWFRFYTLTELFKHDVSTNFVANCSFIGCVVIVTKYTFLGVSYRKGLNLERQSTGKEAMLVAAVEEEAVTRSVELLSDRSP